MFTYLLSMKFSEHHNQPPTLKKILKSSEKIKMSWIREGQWAEMSWALQNDGALLNEKLMEK